MWHSTEANIRRQPSRDKRSDHVLFIQPLTQRRGIALIELLLAMMILSLVLATTAVALHAMFRVNSRMHQDLAYSVQFPRLSIQLRQDAHAAAAAEITADPQSESSQLTLQLPMGRQVRYEATAQRVVRVVHRDEQELQHEVFPLQAAAVRWEIKDEPRLLSLQIERNVGEVATAEDSIRVDRIEAAVGLHRRVSPD